MHAQHRDGEIGSLVEAAAQRSEKSSAASPGEKARFCSTFGALYELCEQYPAAEGWYRRLLEAQPGDFEPSARVLAKQKRGSEAVSVCLDAAKHVPASRAALMVCGMRAAGQIEEKEFGAAAALVAAAEKDKPEPQFLTILAAARIAQERTGEAIALYQQVLAAQPQDPATLNNLATLLGEQPGHGKEVAGYRRSRHRSGWPARLAAGYERRDPAPRWPR